MYLLTESETLKAGAQLSFTSWTDADNIIDGDLATFADSLHRAIEFAPDMLHSQSSLPRNVLTDIHLNVSAATPKKHAGLQAVDYFIWALQRLYERGEDRYVEYLWWAFRLVHDIDDTRKTD